MKRTVCFLLVALLAVGLWAEENQEPQDESLITIRIDDEEYDGDYNHDDHGKNAIIGDGIGPCLTLEGLIRKTKVAGHSALLYGARVGLLKDDDDDIFGVGGFILDDDINAPGTFIQDDDPTLIDFYYVGPYLQNNTDLEDLVHVSFTLLAGVGKIEYTCDDVILEDDLCFVVEPGAGIAVNVLPFLSVGMDWNYRWTNNVKMPHLTNGDLSGHAFTFTTQVNLF